MAKVFAAVLVSGLAFLVSGQCFGQITQLRATLDGHNAPVCSVAFSPDGRMVASGSWNGRIMLWEALTGKLRATLQSHKEQINSLAFSPSGKVLAFGTADDSIE